MSDGYLFLYLNRPPMGSRVAMKYEANVLPEGADDVLDHAPASAAPAVPAGTVMADRATAWLRAWLERRGLEDYQVFCSNDLDLHDVDDHLEALGARAWEPVPSMVPGGVQPAYLSGRRTPESRPAGIAHLRAHEAALARWYWYDTDDGAWYAFHLLAAPSAAHYAKLREALRDLRRRPASAVWQVVSGAPWRDGEKLPRDGAGLDDLILSDAVRARLEAEVVGFFSDEAAGLYRSLGVPYRRGVLLYGSPGNGKTSIIRALAARLPAVSGFVLRSAGSVGDDDFTTIVKRWSAAAPAILVIEDLNWLFPSQVNVSTFLNLFDGLEAPRGAGLMLVGSTNHPETLDPAINDRPGRFDVTMEVPSPDAALRRAFFRRALPDLADDAALARLTWATAGLSFAHLREVIQAAGLSAIRAGRAVRTADDLFGAADALSKSHRNAGRGFPISTEEPFGLAQFRGGASRDAENGA